MLLHEKPWLLSGFAQQLLAACDQPCWLIKCLPRRHQQPIGPCSEQSCLQPNVSRGNPMQGSSCCAMAVHKRSSPILPISEKPDRLLVCEGLEGFFCSILLPISFPLPNTPHTPPPRGVVPQPECAGSQGPLPSIQATARPPSFPSFLNLPVREIG